MLTKHVELPSKGLYYPENHPLYNKDTIEVKLFTAKEQDLLTDSALAKSGQTIDALLQSIIIDRTIRPRTLLSGDRTAILIKSRQYSLGAEYKFNWTCDCQQQNEQSIDLSILQFKNSPQKAKAPEFETVLPVSGKLIKYRLMFGSDQQIIRQIENNRKKAKLPPAMVTTRLNQMIISIDGNTDSGEIRKFVQQMSARDSGYLRKEYRKNNCDLDTNIDVSCKACNKERKISMPISASFFRVAEE